MVRQLIPFIDTYGVMAGPGLVVLAFIVEGRRRRTMFRAGMLLTMTACAAASLWIVSPRIRDAVSGTPEFRTLHGLSVAIMMTEAILGLIVLGLPVRERTL